MELLFMFFIGAAFHDIINNDVTIDGAVKLNTIIHNKQYKMDMPDIDTCLVISKDIEMVNSFCTTTNNYKQHPRRK